MQSRDVIIKIAFGVSAVALLFSAVTLVRAIVVGQPLVFPIVQVVGSAAIFAICFWMFRMLNAEPDDAPDEEPQETTEPDGELPTAEEAVDQLYQKYNLSDFE